MTKEATMNSELTGASPPQGPRVYNQTASRIMTSYVIDEGELEMLAEHEIHNVVASSAASFLAAAALAFGVEWILASSFATWGPLCIAAGILTVPFLLWGRRAHSKRGAIVKKIKKDSFMPDNDEKPRQQLGRGTDG